MGYKYRCCEIRLLFSRTVERERGKLVLTKIEAISIWDVNTMNVNTMYVARIHRGKIRWSFQQICCGGECRNYNMLWFLFLGLLQQNPFGMPY